MSGHERGLRSLTRLVRVEISAARMTPTTAVLLGGSMVMAAGSCLASLAAAPAGGRTSAETLRVTMHSSTVATVVFAMVVGVVITTADFRFSRMDQLVLSQPDRRLVALAKAVVGGMVGMLYGLVGAIVALATTAGVLMAYGESFDAGSAVIVRPLLGAIPAAGLLAVVGVGIGLVVQNQPLALGGSLALLLVVEPTVLVGLPDVARWLPGASALAVTYAPDAALLSQGSGLVLLAMYSAVAVWFGARRLAATDL